MERSGRRHATCALRCSPQRANYRGISVTTKPTTRQVNLALCIHGYNAHMLYKTQQTRSFSSICVALKARELVLPRGKRYWCSVPRGWATLPNSWLLSLVWQMCKILIVHTWQPAASFTESCIKKHSPLCFCKCFRDIDTLVSWMHNEPLIAAQTVGRKIIRPEGEVGTARGGSSKVDWNLRIISKVQAAV